jgi:hypothetical protein
LKNLDTWQVVSLKDSNRFCWFFQKQTLNFEKRFLLETTDKIMTLDFKNCSTVCIKVPFEGYFNWFYIQICMGSSMTSHGIVFTAHTSITIMRPTVTGISSSEATIDNPLIRIPLFCSKCYVYTLMVQNTSTDSKTTQPYISDITPIIDVNDNLYSS